MVRPYGAEYRTGRLRGPPLKGFSQAPRPVVKGLGLRRCTVICMVRLAIENASTFSIAVVDGPVAFRRGGASPCLSTSCIIAQQEAPCHKFFRLLG